MSSDEYERREGPIERRVGDLEAKYNTIIQRLNTIDESQKKMSTEVSALTTLRNQIEGVLTFLRFVGFMGLITLVGLALRFVVKDALALGGH